MIPTYILSILYMDNIGKYLVKCFLKYSLLLIMCQLFRQSLVKCEVWTRKAHLPGILNRRIYFYLTLNVHEIKNMCGLLMNGQCQGDLKFKRTCSIRQRACVANTKPHNTRICCNVLLNNVTSCSGNSWSI